MNNWRNGVNSPQMDTSIALSDLIGVSLDELYKSEIDDIRQKRNYKKFNDLEETEKDILYKLCKTSGRVYFPISASEKAIHIKSEMLSLEEFTEYYKTEVKNDLIVERMKDFFYKVLKNDSRLNRLWKNIESSENPQYFIEELAEEACKYASVAFKADDGKTARNSADEPYARLYDADKPTTYKDEYDFNRLVSSLTGENEQNGGSEESESCVSYDGDGVLPIDYNFIDTDADANSFNTYYYWEIGFTRTDLVNFFSDVHSHTGIALVASVAAQEENLKQRHFQTLVDKGFANIVSEAYYTGMRVEDGHFVFALSFDVEPLLEDEEKLSFLTQYCRKKNARFLHIHSSKEENLK